MDISGHSDVALLFKEIITDIGFWDDQDIWYSSQELKGRAHKNHIEQMVSLNIKHQYVCIHKNQHIEFHKICLDLLSPVK